MGDHTRPLTAYDWTMQIPTIWRHPAADRRRSPARHDDQQLRPDADAALLSRVSPTGCPTTRPGPAATTRRPSGGRDAGWDDVVFFEFENVRAIRTDRWKYIERFRQEPNELYDLEADPGERVNLIDRAGSRRGPRANSESVLRSFFERYAEPEYDLWHGGRVEVGPAHADLFGLDDPERAPRPGP